MIVPLLLACAPDLGAPTPGANVLLFTLDTLRADVVGSRADAPGASGATPGDSLTPTLDRLARDGVSFDHAYTVTPLTIPAHASIHTGLWPPGHGVRDNGDVFLGDPAHTLAEALHDAHYATMASVGAEVTSHHWGFAQGFDNFFDNFSDGLSGGSDSGTGPRRWTVERRGDAVVQDATFWLKAHVAAPGAAPWFAWVHLYDAHDPYEAPEPYASRYAAAPYRGEVAYADAQVGALLDTLDTLDVLDDTWVIVVGDHGESLGDHGESTHGVLLYDATTHVPFLVRPPHRGVNARLGGSAGRGVVVSAPVSLVDVMPTILAAVGVPVPQGLDGVSLLPLLGGAPPADPDRAVYAESLYAWRHFGWAPQRALMTRDLTLLHSTTPELYARADVTQATDLAPSDPAALEGMEGRLAALLAGMKPVAPDAGAGHVAVDAERIAALEALGYLTGVSTKGRDAAGAPVAGLPDPGKRLPVLREVEAAEQAYRRGDLATARTTAEAAVAADPGLVETQMLLASIRWRQGAPEEALRIVTAVDAQLPTAETRHLLGLLQLQLGHPEEAARLLGDAVARDPYLAAAAEVHLQTLLVLEDLPGLLAAADRARAALPDSAVVMGMAGVAKALAGDFAAAGPLLVEAVRREPGQPFVHHALGLVAEDAGEADQAEAAFREEIRRFPPATASRRALAALQARRSAGPLAQPR